MALEDFGYKPDDYSGQYTEQQRREIIAYLGSTLQSVYKYKDLNPDVLWKPSNFLNNQMVEDARLETEFEKNNHYNIPNLKKAVEEAQEEGAMPWQFIFPASCKRPQRPGGPHPGKATDQPGFPAASFSARPRPKS